MNKNTRTNEEIIEEFTKTYMHCEFYDYPMIVASLKKFILKALKEKDAQIKANTDTTWEEEFEARYEMFRGNKDMFRLFIQSKIDEAVRKAKEEVINNCPTEAFDYDELITSIMNWKQKHLNN